MFDKVGIKSVYLRGEGGGTTVSVRISVKASVSMLASVGL